MPGLVLDEGRADTVLYEVAYIAVAQAAHRQLGRQTGAAAPLGEALVNAPGRYPLPPFGEPQRPVPGAPGRAEGALCGGRVKSCLPAKNFGDDNRCSVPLEKLAWAP
jgi:hypothetical protein